MKSLELPSANEMVHHESVGMVYKALDNQAPIYLVH